MRRIWLRFSALAMTVFIAQFSSSLFSSEAQLTTPSQKESVAAIFTVNSTGDQSDALLADNLCDVDLIAVGQQCTLRAAIEQANATTGADTIDFSLGGGNPSISPAAALPTITDQVTIDGNTGGATRVQIIGTSAGAASHGLVLGTGSSGSTIKSMVVRNFGDNGIRILSNDNFIEDNYVGTTETGNAAAANGGTGVVINAASGNTIGGATPAERNVISGNLGSGISISSGSANIAAGKYIGIGANGTSDVGNAINGVEIGASTDNTIGGLTATPGTAPGNVISGNGGDGVQLLGGGVSGNLVRGNIIGLQAGGAATLSNGANGVLLTFATNSTVGGDLKSAQHNLRQRDERRDAERRHIGRKR